LRAQTPPHRRRFPILIATRHRTGATSTKAAAHRARAGPDRPTPALERHEERNVLNDAEKKLILNSWRLVIPIQDTAADLFYRRLFELQPSYQGLFKSDLATQKRKLIAMLGFVVQSLDWPDAAWRDTVAEEDDLFLVVLALGRRHSELYSVPDAAYASVGEALLWRRGPRSTAWCRPP
jgi:hypothetical protein